MIGQILGVGCGAAAAGLVAEHFGWRAVFALLGLLMLAVAAGLRAQLRANPLAREAAPAEGGSMYGAVGKVFGLLAQPRCC